MSWERDCDADIIEALRSNPDGLRMGELSRATRWAHKELKDRLIVLVRKGEVSSYPFPRPTSRTVAYVMSGDYEDR